MHVRRLLLRDFRNYQSVQLPLAPGINVFCGPNGQGKTNLLEAVYVCALGRSPRALRDAELLRHGCSRAGVELTVEREERGEAELTWSLGESAPAGLRRHRTVNEKRADSETVLSWLRVVLFGPDEMELVKGPAEARRRFLDVALSQFVPAYAAHLRRFGRILQQRNRLLKQIVAGDAGEGALNEWEPLLIEETRWICERRATFVDSIRPVAARAYGEVSGGAEVLGLEFHPAAPFAEGEEGMRAAFGARRREEIARGITLMGPHRDDLLIELDGRPARAYGSQGQQRTVAIALKAAERHVQAAAAGDPPVMLLDDVLSELDPARQEGLLRLLTGQGQALVTTAQESEARRLALGGAFYRVGGGVVRAEAA
jgi:DNA replication and repair protein RecF